jgi:hypothetical protein
VHLEQLAPPPAPDGLAAQVRLRAMDEDPSESPRVRVGESVHVVLVPGAHGADVRVVAVGTCLGEAVEQRLNAR